MFLHSVFSSFIGLGLQSGGSYGPPGVTQDVTEFVMAGHRTTGANWWWAAPVLIP